MESRSRTSRLERLVAVSKRIAAEEDTGRLLELALDAMVDHAAADQAFILLLDPEGRPRVRSAHNLDRATVRSSRFRPYREVADYVLRTGEPFVGSAGGPGEGQPGESLLDPGRVVAALPLRSREQVMGVVYLDQLPGGELAVGGMDLRVLQDFGEAVAVTIETRRELRALRTEVLRLRDVKASLEQKASSLHDEVAAKSVELAQAGRALADIYGAANIVGRSPAMRRVFEILAQVSDYAVPVLVTGESGTGKELIARALHHGSSRASEPFMAVNCAAIPEHLLESELFGYRKGAFTGAQKDKPGLFRAARGGTVFLDEVGELPLGLQAKLLRVLQEREVRPVGGTEALPMDARVIAATNADLARGVASGRFREDLFYRLNVVHIELPPLRERVEDIPLLAQHLLDRFCQEVGLPPRRFSAEAIQRMMRAPWPGNIRQLENGVKASAILSREPVIPANALRGIEGLVDDPRPTAPPSGRIRNRVQWEAHEREAIIESLVRCGWNKTRAAHELGISRRNLYRKLTRYGIEGEDDEP
ncbi:MAG: sigma-54-dependent Fis family transcriptional regulator [Myxococcales bacterium]|nr:sigma-54-dependent Fis family transcriptional regulator [Myxococcales bacterium]MCB9522238.1 sigma-54-dependent Fis family transcriptional regulator [Myxococcales bacterium]